MLSSALGYYHCSLLPRCHFFVFICGDLSLNSFVVSCRVCCSLLFRVFVVSVLAHWVWSYFGAFTIVGVAFPILFYYCSCFVFVFVICAWTWPLSLMLLYGLALCCVSLCLFWFRWFCFLILFCWSCCVCVCHLSCVLVWLGFPLCSCALLCNAVLVV